MLKYILKKIIMIPLSMLFISVLVFFVISAVPGNFTQRTASRYTTKAQLESRKSEAGLDKPIITRYFERTAKMLRGDFGYSSTNRKKVGEVIFSRAGITLQIGTFALVLQLLISLPLGIIAAKYKKAENLIDGFSFLSLSLPMFFTALVLKNIFAFKLNLLPADGFQTVGFSGGGFSLFFDRLSHLILPSVVLCLADVGSTTRYVKFFASDVINSEYMDFARLKGTNLRARVIHLLKNMLLPFLNVVAYNLPNIFVGSYIVEEIFSLNGLGKTVMTAFFTRDYDLIMAYTMLLSLFILVCNSLSDILGKITDKRADFAE